MTQVFSFMGRKGGITKSTLATNTAAACARAGFRTVLIDADGQGNASSLVGIDPHDGLYDLLINDREFAEVLRPVPMSFHGKGELHLLSSWANHRLLERNDITIPGIYERLDELDGWAQVVIVDTSPSITDVHTGLYYASDYVILPTLLNYPSILSLASTMTYLESARIAGEKSGYEAAKVLGIVPNRLDARKRVQLENLGYLKGKYEDVCRIFPFMRDLTAWEQATQSLQSIFNYRGDDMSAVRAAILEAEPLVNAVQVIVEDSEATV